MPVTPDDGRPSEQDVEGASKLAWKHSTNTSLVLVQVHAHRTARISYACTYIWCHQSFFSSHSDLGARHPHCPVQAVMPMTLHILLLCIGRTRRFVLSL